MASRRIVWLIILALTCGTSAAAVMTQSSERASPDPFGIRVPGLDEILGTNPTLQGRVPPDNPAPVRIAVYETPRRSRVAAPELTKAARVSGGSWSLPVTLGAGRYELVVQQPRTGGRPLTWTQNFSVTGDPTIAAAGDIACDPASKSFHGGKGSPSGKNCQERATSDLLVGAGLSAVLSLGDEQYETGQPSAFDRSFGETWGRVKHLIHPAPGNHEYATAGSATGYFQYFDGPKRPAGAAGRPGEGWYSFQIGAWHIVALNSNCHYIGGCGVHSAELAWLRADLREHRTACTLAYWHHPRFSSGKHGPNTQMTPIWQTLQAAGVDVVLVGHDHDYERFAPQTAAGTRDYAHGIREFVVGTGGKSHDPFRATEPNSQKRNAGTYGVLELVLHPNRYDWRFVPVAGKHFVDAGSTACH